MSAYAIVDAEVHDEEILARYRELAVPSIELYGGTYTVKGAVPEAAEGEEWPASRVMVVLRFPDMARLKEWYASPEYARAREVRSTGMDLRLLFVEGADV
ncbi:DUF1330 domain-containing protein [Streptomyces sp. NPDC053048]|uniref:DUF1330 domain-containing protein n=1 Tax=Streptomyces sp. NPDC053048 TaxID=3365694 RepID=UPI0037D70083